jgi:hypothetical protein
MIYRVIIVFFWILNVPGLILYTPSYGKKARVEAMTFLSARKNIRFILIEDSNKQSATMLPAFYLNQWPCFYKYPKPVDLKTGCSNLASHGNQSNTIYSLNCLEKISHDSLPDFVIFVGTLNLEQRVEKMSRYLPGMEFLAEIKPGLRDRLMYAINPVNYNVPLYIYKTASYPKGYID